MSAPSGTWRACSSDARFVVSSWGTTALLEACIFDTPSLQLRWMDALPRGRAGRRPRLVRDFQRYIHMRAFDATGARPYCDHPSQLNTVLDDLEQRAEHYARCRAEAVARLVCLPLGGVVPGSSTPCGRSRHELLPAQPAGLFRAHDYGGDAGERDDGGVGLRAGAFRARGGGQRSAAACGPSPVAGVPRLARPGVSGHESGVLHDQRAQVFLSRSSSIRSST